MKQTVQFTLDDQQSAFISDMVKEGRFAEASDVLGAGLKLLEHAEAHRLVRIDWLETEIAAGLASGQSEEWEGVEALLKEASHLAAR
jgi:putative addiction module CopG family antidote